MNIGILVTGSRNVPKEPWHQLVFTALNARTAAADRIIIMHGACPNPYPEADVPIERVSIDMLAHRWASKDGVIEMAFPANWKTGLSAGPQRNELMVDTMIALVRSGRWKCKVVAFHPDIRQSKGTRHTIEYARDAGCPVVLFDAATFDVLPGR